MRSFLILFLFFTPYISYSATNNDICQKSANNGYAKVLTSPKTSEGDSFFICFDAKDYSRDVISSVAGGVDVSQWRITSTYQTPETGGLYLSIHDNLKGFSYITKVFINSNNKISTYQAGIFNSKNIEGADPDGIFNFIGSQDNSAIYLNFLEPNQASVYKLNIEKHSYGDNFYASKLSSGYGEWVRRNGNLVISKDKIILGRGRITYGVIIDGNGKELCHVDTTDKAWALSAKCP